METLLHAGLSNALSATFLALLVACLGRVLARRPAILHCLWLLVLLKLVTPPLYEIPISWPETLAASPEAESTIGVGTPVYMNVVEAVEPVESTGLEFERAIPGLTEEPPAAGILDVAIARAGVWLSLHWVPIVAAIWLAGTLATLLISVRRISGFQLLLREAQPATDDVQDWVDQLAANLGIERAPEAWWISGRLSPMLWALGGCPRLIIPIDLWKSLDERQRGTLLVHELAHLRRGDHRVRIFELGVTALYWWNPVLWWARQALRDVEEQCCDAWVVWAFPEAAKSYAETLLETLDFLNQSELSEPLLASGFGKVHHLRRRLTMIMSGTTPRLVSLWGALGALSLGALLLPVNATWAQKPEDNKELQVIVKIDDDSKKPVDLFGTVEMVGNVFIADDAIVSDADDRSDQVRIVLDTDDSSVSVSADSFGEALKKINGQLQELTKKTPLGDKEKAQQKALLQIAKQLEQLAKSNKGEAKIAKRVVVRRDDIKTADYTPEKKAEIEKARARINELSKALAAAKLDLAKLEGNSVHGLRVFAVPHPGNDAKSEVHYEVLQPKTAKENLNVVVRKKIEADVAERTAAAKSFGKKLEKVPTARFFVEQKTTDGDAKTIRVTPAPAAEDRIQALEKKLNKLLEEVAGLKKDRDK